jgi:hypothetical protein
MLASIDALANVVFSAYDIDTNRPSITIHACGLLSECSISSICEQFTNTDAFLTIVNNGIGCQSVAAVAEGCESLGVVEMNLTPIRIYPSLAEAVVTISAGDFSQVEIFDTMGKMVLKTQLESNSFNIEKLSTGRYIVRLTDRDRNVTSHDLIVK